MRMRGVCIRCGRLAMVNATRPGPGVPTGLCDQCQALEDRPANEVAIYVPASSEGHGILPGSAIIGEPQDPGFVLVYYEGNRIGVADLALFEGRLARAADRLVDRAPTVARSVLPRGAVAKVGTYDTPHRRIVRIDDPAALEQWLAQAPTRWCKECSLPVIPCYRASCPAGWHHVRDAHALRGVTAGHQVLPTAQPGTSTPAPTTGSERKPASRQPLKTVSRTCPWADCNLATERAVDAAAYGRWLAGIRIQEAFPHLSSAEREWVKSGYCPTHMEILFGGARAEPQTTETQVGEPTDTEQS